MPEYTDQISVLAKAAAIHLARSTMQDFVLYNKQDYQVNWHHTLLCEHLDRFIDGDITHLMVFMPPQHGKSELVSRNLPAKILGKYPKAKIALTSYSAHLAESFNRDVQRIIDSEPYHELYPDTYLNDSNIVTVAGQWLRNSEKFETVGHGGFLKTVGIGGPLTGSPVDFGIIDDPVKDSVEAQSSTYRNRAWDWWNDVFQTRLHNKSRVLLTMTRWHVDDLAGRLLKQAEEGLGPKWVILRLPAIREDMNQANDPRELGDALWPDRHSLERMQAIRATSPRTFIALYQQNPRPVETGGEFYHAFRAATHTRRLQYDPTQALHISFDDNVNPYLPAGIFQLVKVDGVTEIRMIEKFTGKAPNNKVKWVCERIVARFHNELGHAAGLFVYGDATADKDDTKVEKGMLFYAQILRYLSVLKPRLRVPSANPSVVMRGLFMNAIMGAEFAGLRLVIDDRLTEAIDDFSYIKEDSDGGKLKEKAKDANGVTYEQYGHFSDLTDYVVCMAFANQYIEFQRVGKTPAPTSGRSRSRKSY